MERISDPMEGRQEPTRRCLATGDLRPKAALLRFAVDPEGRVVPDFKGRLPGRGLWVTPERAAIEVACRKNLFSRAARRALRVDADLLERTASLAARQCLDLLGMARRGGTLVMGFDKVQDLLRSGHCGALVQAADAAAQGREKLRRLAMAQTPAVPVVELFTLAELDRALGRENTVHIAIASAGITDRFVPNCNRLQKLRGHVDPVGSEN